MADSSSSSSSSSSAPVTEVAAKEEQKTVSSKPDITLNCKECTKDFVFSGGEQDFYASKGYDKNPLRCQDCRRARKQAARGRGRGRGSNRGRGRGGFRSNGDRSNGDSNGMNVRSSPPAGSTPGQCYAFFTNNNCRYGDSCRYKHDK